MANENANWPGRVERSSTYGNFVVARRFIEEGEIVIEEFPLVESPDYGPLPEGQAPDTDDIKIHFCLNCSLKTLEEDKCGRCGWPLCQNGICNRSAAHLEAECVVFCEQSVLPRYNPLDYSAVGLYRCLQLRETDTATWEKIIKLEAHTEPRKRSKSATELTNGLMAYARNKLSLFHYTDDEIEHAIGVLTVNTFWTIRDIPSRSASLLFDKVALLAHDCNPTTEFQIMEKQVLDINGLSQNQMFIRITAKQNIFPGQLISIGYVNCTLNVEERQERLKEWFFFQCRCLRCSSELVELRANNRSDTTSSSDEAER